MVTINNTFHVTPSIVLPVIIPASEIPEVALGPSGAAASTYIPTVDPDVAHTRALHWLGVERALRKRAAEMDAERLRAEAAAKAKAAEEEAVVVAEAKELRLSYYDDACPDWDQIGSGARKPWLRQAREALQRHGKLAQS